MMQPMRLAQIAPALSASLIHGDAEFSAVSIDSRTLNPGELFIAIKGAQFDGHRFIDQAESKGAAALLVSAETTSSLAQLKVEDTRIALGLISALNRDAFPGQVLAVTGSAGKTTVKEMVAAILLQKGPVLATKGNLNNDIGAPLTLLSINAQHHYAVIELGASALGEIAYTAALTKPHVAILTNAAAAHIEGFGSLANVVTAKGEIFDGLDANGVGVINRDDPHADLWIARVGQRRYVTFSTSAQVGADYYADRIELLSDARCSFELVTPEGGVSVTLNHLGTRNVANAVAAAAGANALGATLAQIKAGLESVHPVAGRLRRLRGRGDAVLIDDSYNANPASVRAAIDVLAHCARQKVLVLGDMAELGTLAESAHSEVGTYAREAGVDQLLSVGPLSAVAANSFGGGGRSFASKKELTETLKKMINQNYAVLVKGSRSAGMEEVVAALTEGETTCC